MSPRSQFLCLCWTVLPLNTLVKQVVSDSAQQAFKSYMTERTHSPQTQALEMVLDLRYRDMTVI